MKEITEASAAVRLLLATAVKLGFLLLFSVYTRSIYSWMSSYKGPLSPQRIKQRLSLHVLNASRFVHLLEITIKFIAIKQIGHGLFTFPTEMQSLS